MLPLGSLAVKGAGFRNIKKLCVWKLVGKRTRAEKSLNICKRNSTSPEKRFYYFLFCNKGLAKDWNSCHICSENCSISRTFSIYPNSPMWRPSTATSSGFLLQPASDSRRWYWPSRPSTELHPSTPKHWSDHTPQHKHAGWYHHRWERANVAQQSCRSSLLWRLSGGMNFRPM